MAISCPASETETWSEREMSFSVPGTTITPQPIAKLPNSSDQRAPASESFNEAPSAHRG